MIFTLLVLTTFSAHARIAIITCYETVEEFKQGETLEMEDGQSFFVQDHYKYGGKKVTLIQPNHEKDSTLEDGWKLIGIYSGGSDLGKCSVNYQVLESSPPIYRLFEVSCPGDKEKLDSPIKLQQTVDEKAWELIETNGGDGETYDVIRPLQSCSLNIY